MSSIVLPEKVSVLIKGIQSRKTQYTIDKIIKDHAEDEHTFFVYICHNRKSAANQTLGRISSAFEVDAMSAMSDSNPDISFVMLKSPGDDLNGTNVVSTPDAVSGFIDDNVNTRGLVVLAHPTRFTVKKGESQFMTLIRRISNRPSVSRIMVYIDEADAYDKILETHVDSICSNCKVQNCLLFSGTWEDSKYFKKRGIPPERRIELEESVDTSMYWTYDELQKKDAIVYADSAFNSSEWMSNIIYYLSGLRHYKQRLYVYMPSEFDRKSHFDMINTARTQNWVVGIFNSNLKGFILPGNEYLDLTVETRASDLPSDVFVPYDNSEFYELSAGIKHYREKHTFDYLLVTGNSCLGRAVTLQSDGLVFDVGVISEKIARGDALYQADRLKGNIKLFREKPPMYITSRRAFKTLVARENNARLCERKNNTKTSDQVIKESRKLATDVSLPVDIHRYNLYIPNEDLIELTSHTGTFFSSNGGHAVTRMLLNGLELTAPTSESWHGFNECKLDYDSGKFISTFTKKGPRPYSVSEGKNSVRGVGGIGLLNRQQLSRLVGANVLPSCAEVRRYPVYRDDSDCMEPDLIVCLLTKTAQPHLDKWKV
jgi:hypothetical protein